MTLVQDIKMGVGGLMDAVTSPAQDLMDNVFDLPKPAINPIEKSHATTLEVNMSSVGVPVFDNHLEQTSLQIPRQYLTMKQIDALFDSSDIAKIIIRTLGQEIFRNGMEVQDLFSWKCQNPDCEKEYPDFVVECEECSGPVRQPNWQEHRKLRKWLKRKHVNSFNQNFYKVLRQCERDLNRYDNCFIFLQKGYVFTSGRQCGKCYTEALPGVNNCPKCGSKILEPNMLLANPVKEIYRASPYWMKKVQTAHGMSRNESGDYGYVCVNHRDTAHWKKLPGTYMCPACSREMFPVEYEAERNFQKDNQKSYYVRGEIWHGIKFEHNPGYGVSPMFVIWMKLLTLYQMDKYIFKMFSLQRSPRGLLFLRGKRENIQQSWMWMQGQARENPNMIYPVAVDQAVGDKGSNAIAQYVDLALDMGLMNYIETREEYRRLMGMVYGVEPIFQGDMSTSGGLNNEGLQVTVTNRAMQEGQIPWNDDFFLWFSEQCGVTDCAIRLNPNEEKDEMAQLEREDKRMGIAQKVQGLGYEIELEEGDDGLDFKVGEKNPELRTGAGGMGAPGGPDFFGGAVDGFGAGLQGGPQDGGSQAMSTPQGGAPDMRMKSAADTETKLLDESAKKLYGMPFHQLDEARQNGVYETLMRQDPTLKGLTYSKTKGRRYIKRRDEAPIGVQVQQGAKGGYYYDLDEKGPTGELKKPTRPPLAEETVDNIPGGLAHGLTILDIAKKHGVPPEDIEAELHLGIEMEAKHGAPIDQAREIAMDNLVEDPQYYTHYKEFESQKKT